MEYLSPKQWLPNGQAPDNYGKGVNEHHGNMGFRLVRNVAKRLLSCLNQSGNALLNNLKTNSLSSHWVVTHGHSPQIVPFSGSYKAIRC
jgi:hypothetical protein